MALKIPSDISEVIKSTAGHEPVAFVDVWPERGDFDIIDTENQFKAIDDPANSNDTNIDFDRKPGFAVIAPGKKVDAALTKAPISNWGAGTVSFGAIGAPAVSISPPPYVLGIGNSGSNLVALHYGRWLGAHKTGVFVSSDGGQSWDLTELVGTNTDYSVMGSGNATGIDTFSNFDGIFNVTGRGTAGYGDSVEFLAGSASPSTYIFTPPFAYSGARRYSCAKINGQYFVGFQFADGTNSAICVYDADGITKQPTSFIGTSAIISSISYYNGEVFIANKLSSGVVEIYKATQTAIGSYSWNLVNSVAIPAGWPAGATFIRFVGGNMCLFCETLHTAHLVSTDLGVSFSETTPPLRPNRIETNKFDSGKLVAWNLGTTDSIMETSDGITWTQTEIANFPNSTSTAYAEHYSPMVHEAGGNIHVMRSDLCYSSEFVALLQVSNEFSYDVLVADVYSIDSGRGKK